MKKIESVKVVYPAPGKKGKQEVRNFKTIAEALAYITRNKKRMTCRVPPTREP